ncbi:MAG: nucleotidyltransferase family protein [Prolixibacteraceae bacterium]|nr:nucleotidyltransferase family protein [Prolixibacteraceae bacterium]
MKNSELFFFIAHCLALDHHPEYREKVVQELSSATFPLDGFVRVSSNQLVLPAVYLKLKTNGLLVGFPDDYCRHLDEIYQMNVQRNQRIKEQVDELSECLGHENIQPVYMKGTGNLLDNLYLDTGERMIGDIDLLVRENEYLKAAELIIELGYVDESKLYDDVSTLKHYPRLFKKDVPADVEIHRVPVSIKYAEQFSSEMLFLNRKEIPEKENCFVPDDEHKIIQNFIHSQLSNSGFRFKITSMRDLYDSFLLLQRVNVADILTRTEEKEKAESYFVFTDNIFNSLTRSVPDVTKTAQKYYNVNVWMSDHPKAHRRYIFLLKFYELIIQRYLLTIVKAVYQKSSRDHIFNRLKDPGWYKMHFRGLKNFFS